MKQASEIVNTICQATMFIVIVLCVTMCTVYNSHVKVESKGCTCDVEQSEWEEK